jgi:hypothetical protein
MCLKIRQKQQEFLQISQLQKSCCFFMSAYCIKRTEKRAESSGKLPETVKAMPRKLVDKKA